MGNQRGRRKAWNKTQEERKRETRKRKRETEREHEELKTDLGIDRKTGGGSTSNGSAQSHRAFYEGELIDLLNHSLILSESGLEYSDDNEYLVVECPKCSRMEAYIYRGGDLLICNRREKCCFRGSLLGTVIDEPGFPRGSKYVHAVEEMARLHGVEIPAPLEAPEFRQQYQDRGKRSDALEAASETAVRRLKRGDELGRSAMEYLASRGFPNDWLPGPFGLFEHSKAVTAVADVIDDIDSRREAELYCRDKLGLTEDLDGYLVLLHRDLEGFARGFICRWASREVPPGKPKVRYTKGLQKDVPYLLGPAMREQEFTGIVLVEGPFDALLPRAHGFPDATAIGGAALTRKQAQTLRRATVKNVTICLDSDEAGRAGTLKTIERLEAVGIRPDVAESLDYTDRDAGEWKQAKDPAELIANAGIREFESKIEFARPALEDLALRLVEEHAGDFSPREIKSLMAAAQDAVDDKDPERLEEGFWRVLKENVMDNAGLTEEEFHDLQALYDPELELKDAKPKIAKFLDTILELDSPTEQKNKLLDPLEDERLLEAFGTAHAFDQKWLERTMARVESVRGLGQKAKRLLRYAKEKGQELKAEWQRRVNPPFEGKSHVTLAKEAVSRLCPNSEDLIADRGQIFRFENNHFRRLEKHEVVQAVQSLNGHPYEAETRKGGCIARTLELRSSDVEGIRDQLNFLEGVAQPDFFDEAPPGVQFADCFLRLDTETGELTRLSPAPKYRQRTAYEFDYEPDAPAPRFHQALEDWFEGDEDAAEKQRFLQEICGAFLFGLATKYEKCLVLYGEGGNGKSVFLLVVKEAFPTGSTSAVDPQAFEDDAKVVLLRDKLLNISADIPATEILDSSVFKRVVSGDPTTARPLYKDAFEFRPRAGHIFACNELPRSRDHSNGFFQRLAVVAFNNDFRTSATKRVPNLAEKIIAEELPGVVAWMAQGASRLVQRGGLRLPPSSQNWVDRWRESSNPVALWVRRRTRPVEARDGETLRDAIRERGTRSTVLFEAFNQWATSNNFRKLTVTSFGRRMGRLAEKAKFSDGNYYATRIAPLKPPTGMEETANN